MVRFKVLNDNITHYFKLASHMICSGILVNHFNMPNMLPKYYYVVSCPSLTDLSNGMINCSLGDDKVPSYAYGDTCNFTCNTGYELTGSDTRTCQSNRRWSGSDIVCARSKKFHINYT